MECVKNLHLVLFFTRGVSLRTWDKVGMFEREVSLYRRLQRHGIQVTFVTYGKSYDLDYTVRLPGIRILCNRWHLPSVLYEFLLPILHGATLVRSGVYKTNQTSGAEIALRAARIWKKPLIARCGYMWSEFLTREYGTDSVVVSNAHVLESRVFKAAKHVVVTTVMMANDVAARILGAEDKTVIIPNYVNTEQFCPGEDSGIDSDIIFIGRLSPQKNLEALLEAVKALNYKLTIIGGGELRSELENRFGTYNGRVNWVGNVPNTELPGYLNRARLFILPSYYEGHPKALIEAMACGLPVIGTNVPGIRELINHRETGYLCGTSAVEIRAAIQKVLGDEDLRTRMGCNARKFAVENFSLDRAVEMELALLEQVAE